MKLQILSDLHLEANPCVIPVVGDVIVLAGDIHMGTHGVDWAKEYFTGRQVVYTAGNHEFYGHMFPGLLSELRSGAAGSNVAFLENDVFIKDGVRFLGATLWTDFTLNGIDRQEISIAVAKHGINDFRGRIKKSTGELLRPGDVVAAHGESLAWLRERLSEKHGGPTVVVTHHAPHIRSVPPMFSFDPLSPAFASNLENFIMEFQPALWVSGHTHYCCDYHIGTTRMISNQRGYSDQDDTGGFKPGLVVEI